MESNRHKLKPSLSFTATTSRIQQAKNVHAFRKIKASNSFKDIRGSSWTEPDDGRFSSANEVANEKLETSVSFNVSAQKAKTLSANPSEPKREFHFNQFFKRTNPSQHTRNFTRIFFSTPSRH
jgi:hypothetical protein